MTALNAQHKVFLHTVLTVFYLCVSKQQSTLVFSGITSTVVAVQRQRLSLSTESEIFITLKALLRSHLLFVCYSVVRFQTGGEENRNYCTKQGCFMG